MTEPAEHRDYRQIADIMTEKIRSDALPPGAKLPSTSELAKEYGVSVSTAYRAYILLHDRGLIEGKVGKGRYVKGQPPESQS